MAIVGKLNSNSSGFKVNFQSDEPTLTLKSSSSATSVGSLSDVDTTKAEASESGATLVFDSDTQTFKSEKVFTFDGDNVGLDGGTF